MKKTVPPTFSKRFRTILIYSGKGGVHKTGLCCHISSAALILGARLHLVEVDKQSLLKDLFPDHCSSAHIPSAADLAAKSTADIASLNLLFEAMISDDYDLVVCDIGAGYEGAVMEAIVRSGLAHTVGDLSSIALIIPFNSSDESIESAARASRQGSIALPGAVQIFCAPNADFKPNTRKSQMLWNETISVHVEKNGLMEFPSLGDDVYDIFTAARVAPHNYARIDPIELGRQTGQLRFVAQSSILQVSALTAHVSREAERLLGFRQYEAAQN